MSENMAQQHNREQNILNLIQNKLRKEDCFGLSDQEFIQFKNWIDNARLSESSSKFPDIVFNNGFIEHFGVTSSSESNNKGAKQMRESKLFQKKSETNFLNNLANNEQKELVSTSYSRPFEKHSHTNLINSIQKNWLKHIESYEKSNNSSKHRIFLVEYLDINIETAIVKKNVSSKVYESYRISVDKTLLKWIYKFKEKIDYLILINPKSFSLEVIKISKIPELLKKEIEVWYEPSIGFESHKFYGVKVPGKDM